MAYSEKPNMSSLTRWAIGALCLLLCGATWLGARSFPRAAAAERLAKSGEWTDYRAYEIDALYPLYFQTAVMALGLLIQVVSSESENQALRRPGRIVLAALKISSVAFAASQLLLRTRSHECAVSGSSHVSSLGLRLACEGHEASASTPNYAKMMDYSAFMWRAPLNMLLLFIVIPASVEWLSSPPRTGSVDTMGGSESVQEVNGYVGALSTLSLVGLIFASAYKVGSPLYGSEDMARSGELADYVVYATDSIQYAIGFGMSMAVLMGLSFLASVWGQLTAPRARLVQAATVSAAAAYAAWQIVWRVRDLMMAAIARKCLALDVSYVTVLGFNLACQDAQDCAYASGYVKGLPYVIVAWVLSLVGIVSVFVYTRNATELVVAEEGRLKLDEKLDSKSYPA